MAAGCAKRDSNLMTALPCSMLAQECSKDMHLMHPFRKASQCKSSLHVMTLVQAEMRKLLLIDCRTVS